MWREPIVYVVLGGLFFLLLWALVSFLVARGGGWTRLARAFPRPETPWTIQETLYFRSLALGRTTRYALCVTVLIAQEGLVLKTNALFHLFHAPIFAPWGAIQEAAYRPGWRGGMSCVLAGARLHLPRDMGRRVYEAWRRRTTGL